MKNKRRILPFVAIMLALAMISSAKDKYYYCEGKRMPLTAQSGKVVLLTVKTSQTRCETNDVLKTIEDSQIRIQVVKSAVEQLNKLKESSGKGLHTELCYLSNTGMELIPTGYMYIELKQASDLPLLQKIASRYNLIIVEQNDFMPLWYTLRLGIDNENSIIDIANAIYESGEVSSSFPDFSFDGLEISYDAGVSEQWGLYNPIEGIDINISEAWCYATGRGVKTAIVDNGVDIYHRDLAENIYMSYDCMEKKSPLEIIYGDHGTHCAGIAAAVRNNGYDVAGVAPDAKIMAAGINFNENSPTLTSKLADGINWAWRNGADVISCSWTCPDNNLVKQAIDSALTLGRGGKGCIFVKSAGNINPETSLLEEDKDSITFPGSYRKEVIAVASLNRDGTRCYDSCYGSNMFISAPGDGILSTVPNDGVDLKRGTSMACPHVSGVAALILERNPSLTVNKVREIIARSAVKVINESNTMNEFGEWNPYYGYGIIDACSAVLSTPRIQ